jgi:hypothetical protein
MGTLRDDNGGGRPPDGGGLPDLPPEWGTVVIPDDPAELDDEARPVQREFRRLARRNRWRRRFGRAPVQISAVDDSPALGLPLLIMAIAIIATLTSLFAIAWPSQSHRTPQASNPPAATATALPDTVLTGADGATFRLRESLPAVILLVDGCQCDDLISRTAAAVSAGISVLVVGHSLPALPKNLPADRTVRAAADPAGALSTAFPTRGTTAILATSTGGVLAAVSPVVSVDGFAQYLPRLS